MPNQVDASIGELPAVSTIDNADLFVLEHSGEAKKASGEVFKQYIDRNITDVVVTNVPYSSTPQSTYTESTGVLNLQVRDGPGVARIQQTAMHGSTKVYAVITEAGNNAGTFSVTDGSQGSGNVDTVMGLAPNGSGDVTKASLMDLIYPVGSIYMSINSTSPATLFGVGTWQQIKGRFLVGCDYVDGNTNAPYFEPGSTDGTATTSGGRNYGDTVQFSNGQADVGFSEGAHDGVYLTRKSLSATFTATNKSTPSNGIVYASETGEHTVANINPVALEGTQRLQLPPYFAVYIWARTS